MLNSRWSVLRASLLLTLAVVGGGFVCVVPVTAAPPAAASAPAADVVVSDGKSDPFAVPDGSPDEILSFIQNVANPQRQFASNDELQEYLKHVSVAISEATDRLLTVELTDQQMIDAIEWRVEAQRIKSKLGDENVVKETDAFLANPEFQKRPAVVKAVAKIRLLREQMQLISQLRTWPRMSPAERADFVNQFIAIVKKGEVGGEQFNMAMAVAEMSDMTDDSALGARALNELIPLFKASADTEVAQQLPYLEGIARRFNLPGNKFEMEGKLLNGKPIDWASYRGKVVLIDYWATWCGPCRAEVPNVLENYRKYHDQGFEVIGISLDDKREAVEQYLHDSGVPWPTTFHVQADGDSWGNPMAVKYGVTGIPRAILVDRQGNVVNLNARGPRLGAELQRLFANGPNGPAAEDTSAVEITDGGVTAQSGR
jgi:thiol-disulfide isomerase/thioredoxin